MNQDVQSITRRCVEKLQQIQDELGVSGKDLSIWLGREKSYFAKTLVGDKSLDKVLDVGRRLGFPDADALCNAETSYSDVRIGAEYMGMSRILLPFMRHDVPNSVSVSLFGKNKKCVALDSKSAYSLSPTLDELFADTRRQVLANEWNESDSQVRLNCMKSMQVDAARGRINVLITTDKIAPELGFVYVGSIARMQKPIVVPLLFHRVPQEWHRQPEKESSNSTVRHLSPFAVVPYDPSCTLYEACMSAIGDKMLPMEVEKDATVYFWDAFVHQLQGLIIEKSPQAFVVYLHSPFDSWLEGLGRSFWRRYKYWITRLSGPEKQQSIIVDYRVYIKRPSLWDKNFAANWDMFRDRIMETEELVNKAGEKAAISEYKDLVPGHCRRFVEESLNFKIIKGLSHSSQFERLIDDQKDTNIKLNKR